MPDDMLKRNVNVGFSGGEKKRNEVLQMAILRPQLAILDETDSGLDIDALKIVADGVNALRGPDFSALVITHHQRLLDHLVPNRVHVLARRPDRPHRRPGTGEGTGKERLRRDWWRRPRDRDSEHPRGGVRGSGDRGVARASCPATLTLRPAAAATRSR